MKKYRRRLTARMERNLKETPQENPRKYKKCVPSTLRLQYEVTAYLVVLYIP